MSLKSFWSFFVSLSLLSVSNAKGQAPTPISPQAILDIAVENYPALKVNRADVAYSKANIQIAQSVFNSYYYFEYDKDVNATPNHLRFRNGDTVDGLTFSKDPASTSFYNSFELGYIKRFATGTRLDASLGLTNPGRDYWYHAYKRDLNDDQVITNRSSVFLNVTQPLMLGLGKRYNTAPIKMSELAFSQQEHEYFASANSIVLNLYLSYLEYISAYTYLKIQEETEQRYEKLLEDLTKMAKYDAIPRADLLYIQANLASQKNRAFSAKNSFRYAKNSLGNLLGLANTAIDSLAPPPEKFPTENVIMPVDDSYVDMWLGKSLELRPDYLAIKKALESSEVEALYNKQSIKPRLDLELKAGYQGVYETAKIYEQAVLPFVKNVPGLSYGIGLNFGLSPKFDAAKGRYAASLANMDANKASLKVLENNISLNVKRYFDRINYYKLIVEQSKNAVRFNEDALKNERTKLTLGSSTIINVVQVQGNFIASLENLNFALQNLNEALLLFKFHTGTLTKPGADYSLGIDVGALFDLPY